MEKLVAWISFPLGRLPTATDDNAGPGALAPFRQRHGGRKMHEQCHVTKDSVRVINESDQFAQVRLSPHINYVTEGRMVVALLPDLHEGYDPAEIIHDLLPPAAMPPLYSIVEFASSRDNPVRPRFAHGGGERWREKL